MVGGCGGAGNIHVGFGEAGRICRRDGEQAGCVGMTGGTGGADGFCRGIRGGR